MNAACVLLQRREEDRKERTRIEQEEEELGKTVNGQWVNLDQLKTLCGMGYERSRVAKALKQTNNDICLSLDYLGSDLELNNEESLAQVYLILVYLLRLVYDLNYCR